MRLKREPTFSAAVNMACLSPTVYKLAVLERGGCQHSLSVGSQDSWCVCVCSLLSLSLSPSLLSAHRLATKSLPPCLFIYIAASKRSGGEGEEGGVCGGMNTAWLFNGKM